MLIFLLLFNDFSDDIRWLYQPVPYLEQPKVLFCTTTMKEISIDQINFKEKHGEYWPPKSNEGLETHSKLTRSRARSLHATGSV